MFIWQGKWSAGSLFATTTGKTDIKQDTATSYTNGIFYEKTPAA